MKKFLLAMVAIVVIIGGIFFQDIRRSLWPAGATEITIAQSTDFFLYAPLYVAVDAGLFAERGLDVSITSTGGDEKSWAAVVSGSAQFGVADPTFTAISDQQGQPGRVVASIVNGVPFWGITFSDDIPEISEPSDLDGYTVATFPSPSTAYTLQRDMFTKGGVEPSIRQGAFGALLPMLRAGQADIALELEPNVSTAVNEQGARVLYSLAENYGDFAITGMTTTPEFIEDNPEIVERAVCGIQDALDLIHQDPQRALEVLTARFPDISKDVAEIALERVNAGGIIPTDVAIAEDAWTKAIDLRVEAGDLEVAKTMNNYVDNQFARNCESKSNR